MLEIWKKIEDSIYSISDMGRVRNDKRNTIVKGRILGKGYLAVQINKKNRYIHRLVLEAFMPNKDNLPQVDHINNIKTDNRLENLQWISHSDNQKKAYEQGKNRYHQGLAKRNKGVRFNKRDKKWIATYSSIYIGGYKTEEEARVARNEYLKNNGIGFID